MLEGICMNRYPTNRIEMAVLYWVPTSPRSSSRPSSLALAMALRSSLVKSVQWSAERLEETYVVEEIHGPHRRHDSHVELPDKSDLHRVVFGDCAGIVTSWLLDVLRLHVSHGVGFAVFDMGLGHRLLIQVGGRCRHDVTLSQGWECRAVMCFQKESCGDGLEDEASMSGKGVRLIDTSR
jgi:hypothetical protein